MKVKDRFAKDADVLAALLKDRFGQVAVRLDYGWPQKSALCVLDCVLSLNRRYDQFVKPRVQAFAQAHPEVVDLAQFQALLNQYQDGVFFRDLLHYNHSQREQTLRGVVKHLLSAQAEHTGQSEWERLHAWAASVQPDDHKDVRVPGFGLAGFQYLRMLFGVQTTKPDIHIIRFVTEGVGHKVNDLTALALLDAAAQKAQLPLREADGAIWKDAARNQRVVAGVHHPCRKTKPCT